MGFIKYYISRYYGVKAAKYKLLQVVTSVCLSYRGFSQIMLRYPDGGCAKDIVMVLNNRYFFAPCMLLCSFAFLKLSYDDFNTNILLRYGSRQKIWGYQSFASVIFGMENVILSYITAFLVGLSVCECYDNWNMENSYHRKVLENSRMPLETGMSYMQMIILFFAMKVVLFGCVSIIALLVEYLSNELILSVVSVVFICGLKFINSRFIFNRMDMRYYDMYYRQSAAMRIIVMVVVVALLIGFGYIISKYRQYYKKVDVK